MMRNRYASIAIIISALLLQSKLYGQNVHFPREGVIEFEKTVNMHAQIKRMIENNDKNSYLQAHFDQFKLNEPQFDVSKSKLYFSHEKTIFKPEMNAGSRNNMFYSIVPAVKQLNIVYSNLDNKSNIIQKKVFEQTFLVKDVTRKINWKIVGETREILGFTCRRANAIIMDSIYLVAFYTEEIPVSAGPETFSGLPGMILGLVLPHENVSWFAKSFSEKDHNNLILPPDKGKEISSQKLFDIVNSKDIGQLKKELIKFLLL